MQVSVGIGLLDCGTVGAEVADRLVRQRDAIQRATGTRYDICGIAIRDVAKARPRSLDPRLFTRDARALIEDPRVDVVVETIGGTTDAAGLVESALERGRHVVTANKDLIGMQGPRLRALAAARATTLRYDAAVGGAIPVLRTLGSALAGDLVHSVAGVLNGTCTFVLDAMERGAALNEAVACAQELGFAEADPSNDLEGTDAAHKLAAIAQLAFGVAVISPRIRRRGISGVTSRDIERARTIGARIRLVAVAARSAHGIAAEVAPVLVPHAHEFARTSGSENVVHIDARDAGRLTLRGAGAGGPQTSSAAIGDVMAALRTLGQRRDLRAVKSAGLDPALEVVPFFARHARNGTLPEYPLWDVAQSAKVPA